MAYRGFGSTTALEILDLQGTLSSANKQAADSALNKMQVSASYAGPILKAEQESFDVLMKSGMAGKIPTPAQFSQTLKGMGVSVVSVAATGACGPALGPAAPFCGMAAGYVTSNLADAVFGGSSGCGTKINGICADQWWKQRNAAVLFRCPPGSNSCRDRLNYLWNVTVPAAQAADRSRYEQWRSRCEKKVFGIPSTSVPDDCYEQCPKGFIIQSSCASKQRSQGFPPSFVYQNWGPESTSVFRDGGASSYVVPSNLVEEETRILLDERYKAEYEYIKAVDTQSAVLYGKMEAGCRTSGCRTQVKGIVGEGAYEAAQALRSSTGGPSTAKRVLDQAMLQAQGVVATSQQLSKQQADLENALDSQTENNRKLVLGGLAILAVGVGIFAWRKRR